MNYIETLPDPKDRERHLRRMEKDLVKEYEPVLRKMTYTQGKILLKLINRECSSSPYNLIKAYRGSFTAAFWQGVASLFHADLKSGYDPANKDVGQAGVTVDLYLNGVYYATTTTGASGDYSFVGLPSGVYRVDLTDTQNVLAGYIDTLFPANQTADNNNKVQPYGISLPQASVNLTGDFGYIKPVTIGDFVFVDPNANKIQDPSETTGLPNVPITATNLNTGQVFTTQTGPTGSYQFTNLPPGTYSVAAPPSLPLYLRTTDSPIVRTLPAGTVDNNFDFGYINPTAVAIASLYSTTSKDGITVHWSTLFEEGSDRFFVYRSASESGQRTLLTPNGILSTGNPDGSAYQYVDTDVTLGNTYYYWVEIRPQGDLHGPLVVPYLTPDAGASKLFLPQVVRRH